MARTIFALTCVISLGCTGDIAMNGNETQSATGGGSASGGGAATGGGDAASGGGAAVGGGSAAGGGTANGGGTAVGGGSAAGGGAAVCVGEATDYMPKGAAQLMALCSRGYTDPVSTAFCSGTTPNLTSVDDVLSLLGLKFQPPPYSVANNGANGNPAYILQAQSTSISTRRVSQLNPRSIIFTPPLARGRMTGTPKPNPTFVAMGFTRGEKAIEILAKDPQVGLRFFLLKYELACDSQPGGCTNADLYTPAVESGFTSWSLYDDQDLKNTTLDCLQCHQPSGPIGTRMMRMQELQRPWQHWMYNDALNVATLRADFHAAHGFNEAYGGVPGAAIDMGDAPKMEAFVENNGFINQPNEYQGLTIANEMADAGTSTTWTSQYTMAETGQYIPVPYFDVKATDPVKVQALSAQYQAVVAGTATSMGDLKDVFDDPAMRAMGHKVASGLSGAQILVQACSQCHNSQLDQSISRANFNALSLGTMSRGEKDEAIRRLQLAPNECQHMPPARFRDLDPAEISLAVAELMK